MLVQCSPGKTKFLKLIESFHLLAFSLLIIRYKSAKIKSVLKASEKK